MLSLNEVLERGVDKIYPNKEELASVLSKKKITIYQGFDPSMPSLHLGNFVGLMKLRQFQNLGHKIIFLVGDFTGMIGDPSGKTTARKSLTRKQVLENSKLYKEQASKVISFEGKNAAEMRYNSEWSDKLNALDLMNLASNLTYQQIIERDMFQKRQKEGNDIFLNEFLYPLMQGYDSVAMNVDLEIGGSDQIFNMLMGRKLMRNILKKEKFVLATKLLIDKEGNKVGKTTGNALFLDSTPESFYGGIMSFPDNVLSLAFEILTELSLNGINDKVKKDPLGEKKRLSFEITRFLWGEKKAKTASDAFEETFQKAGTPKDVPIIMINEVNLPLLDLVFSTKMVSSRSETKRLILQKAVELDGKVISNPQEEIGISKKGIIIKIGKKIFVRVHQG